jgi:MtN3 and saliva related transmembrane protein
MLRDWIGVVAGTLTTIAFLPQVLQVIRTKSTQDISLVMYVVFTIGIAFWLAYGIMLDAWPVIIANVVTLILSVIVLAMKLRHG